MYSATIEIIYLFFQGILTFQVLIFLVLYILTRRRDILYYCLFLFFAAAYFFMNAPYTFFGIPEETFWQTDLYTYFNIPLIIVENLFYLLFLRAFFENITTNRAIDRVLSLTIWLIPFMLFIFVFLVSMKWNTQSIFYTVKMISIIPAAIAAYVILKNKPPFAKLVVNGLACTIVGTSLTVIMIALGHSGYHYLFTIGYPLFFIRLGILGDMIFYLGAILQKWHFQEKQLALEKLKAELTIAQFRNKISGELHDDLGSSLSGISMYSYMAANSLVAGQYEKTQQAVGYIQTKTNEIITNLSELVWTINPAKDEFEDIILRMRNFAFELLGAKSIDFEFKVDGDIAEIKLPIETKKNIYLIFKEATNNLAKYSKASKAYFSITRQDSNVSLLIQDDGTGFNDLAALSGNGINNMKKRAEEIKGAIVIDTEMNKGTSIKVTFPV